jgi:hypothetical protein
MRFNVNQKYYFLDLDFTPTSLRFGMIYYPWEDQLNRLSVVALTCEEHHKVGDGYSEEKKCDGFVFGDEQQASWYNQYPEASYGQIDTSNDWIVRKEREAEDIKRSQMTELCTFLENVLRGIRGMLERREKLEDNKPAANGDTAEWLDKSIQSLRDLYIQIDQELQCKFELKAVNVGWTAKFTDGCPPEHMREIPDVVLVPVNQVIEHIAY